MYYYGDKKDVQQRYRSKRITKVENDEEFGDIKDMVDRWETLKKPLKLLEEEGNVTQRACKPRQNIVFIKTHKTGSTTVTNILNRYGDLRDLNMVLPMADQMRFSWPRMFHWSNVDLLRLDGQPGNILCNHARYNREQMDLIMADDTDYITILRNPATQFESSFFYFEFDRILQLRHRKDPVRAFMEFPDEYLYNITLVLNDLPETINLIQSGMFYDLGQDFLDLGDDDAIRKRIKNMETEFRLVMIMEYFDESLVLLKLELCWELEDISYIKQNQRTKRSNLTEDLRERILQWNHADSMLYHHFNQTFWQKVESYGQRFWDDLKDFQQLRNEIEHVCDPGVMTVKGFKINVNVQKYVMNPKVIPYHRYLCQKLLKTEVEYLTYFRKKLGQQYGYQKILIDEGLRPPQRKNILQRRMAKTLRTRALKKKS
uniref:Galactosylceramide sulfotransferase-like n=2 Tax=Clytia hemisphaerica TaxID=252671 RepID=A0A7M5UEF6_9CNID